MSAASARRQGDIVTTVVALPNRTEEGPRRRFLVRTVRLPAGRAAGDGNGGRASRVYHSHPDHPSRPSQYDLDHAWPTSPTSSCR